MIDFIGVEKLNERLRSLSNAEFFTPFLKDVAQTLYDEVEQGVASHSKTGTLERALGDGVQTVGENEYAIRVDSSVAPYAVFLHWGSRPHTIRPKQRKALRWVSGNAFVFAKFINHPGYKGDPFMVTATETVMKDWDSLVKRYLKEL